MSRIDGFSDVVFGFALTLLVVSLEVPRTFDELAHAIRGFVPFAICFSLLMMVWYAHYRFFRRYGLHDFRTILLNACLLFVVLFYVYPLKFLFTILVGELAGTVAPMTFAHQGQVTQLMVLYGLGSAAVYGLLSLMYWNAWRQRDHLELDAIERLLTRASLIDYAGLAGIGLLSCMVAVALPARLAGLAGYVYFAIGPYKTWHGLYYRRKERRLRSAERAPAAAPTASIE
jgi:uncharacterized membrane protein